MLIIGHRGARAVEPENTIRALKKGMQCADFVEVDVRMSSDRVPVIMHDPTLDRTTDGQGAVEDHALEDLKGLDAGMGERIPTLKEVLKLVSGKCGLFVELKEPESARAVCDLIRESTIRNLWLVSFHPEALKTVEEIFPDLQRGLIYSKPIPDPIGLATWSGAHAILPKFERTSPLLVKDAHYHHLLVIPWTLNNEDDIRKAAELGCDGFASDDPCFARQVLKKRES